MEQAWMVGDAIGISRLQTDHQRESVLIPRATEQTSVGVGWECVCGVRGLGWENSSSNNRIKIGCAEIKKKANTIIASQPETKHTSVSTTTTLACMCFSLFTKQTTIFRS
jgi:hypothetical protein